MGEPSAPGPLVLASTSPYRRQLLGRLGLDFAQARPDTDETPLPGEAPGDLAVRLARAKALAVAATSPGAWVIGSDQVADLDGRPLGKAGTRERAIAQLSSMSGRSVVFHTAVCLAGPGLARPGVAGPGDGLLVAADRTVVRFRPLGDGEIARYVDAEAPWDCAGSFKCEGLGIALFEAIETRDPTALVGLPLIATAGLLRRAGFAVP